MKLKKPDRAKERATLAGLQQLFADPAKVRVIQQLANDHVNEVDHAACDTLAKERLRQTGQAATDAVMTEKLLTLLTGAASRCIINCCAHVTFPHTVKHAILAARVLSCRPCLRDYFIALKNEPTNDECDLCLKQGCQEFRNFSVAHAGIIFAGDCCPDCLRLLEDSAKK
jgi:hypothetical protein